MTEEHIYRLKEILRARAVKKFPGDETRQNAYIWGTINKIKRGS